MLQADTNPTYALQVLVDRTLNPQQAHDNDTPNPHANLNGQFQAEDPASAHANANPDDEEDEHDKFHPTRQFLNDEAKEDNLHDTGDEKEDDDDVEENELQ